MDSVTGLTDLGSVYLNLSLLTDSMERGTNTSIRQQIIRVHEGCIKLMGREGETPELWKNMHQAQEVFIGPNHVHAFIKLQSCIASLISSVYLGDTLRKLHAMHSIESYLKFIAAEYKIKTPFN